MQVRTLYIINKALCSPLEAMFALLIFILSKEFDLSLLQLTCLACFKPITSLLSFYCNAVVVGHPQNTKKYLMFLNMIGCLPVFLFPFITSVWFYIFSYAVFMTCLRASFPAWSEILKKDHGVETMASAISKGTSINYFVTILVPLLFSYWMDQNSQIWSLLFFALGLLQILNCVVLSILNIESHSFSYRQVGIVKEGWSLFKDNRHFAQYLILFFLGGAGLVAIQPILPIYFKDTLGLSYMQLTLAISFCKGISFLASSPVWARHITTTSLYFFNGFINLFSCLFIAFLLASGHNQYFLLLAYVMYGTMQAGCELSWNLSGPLFSRDQDSTLHSSLNLVLVGLRGIICPLFGQLLFAVSNVETVFVCSGCLCFASLIYALKVDHEYRRVHASV